MSNNRLTDTEDNVVPALTSISLTTVMIKHNEDSSGSVQPLREASWYNGETRSFEEVALMICNELKSFLDDDDTHAIMIQDRIFKLDDKDELIEMIYE